MKLTVYSIKCILNNKIYIGITNNLNSRWNKHIYDARHNSQCVIHRAIRKYGLENFLLSTIKICETKNELLEQEQFFIRELKTHVSESGYNETWGGEAPMLGRKHTQQTLLKMSKTRKGRVSTNKGKKATELTKRKLSDSHSKAVVQIGLDGAIIAIHQSITKAGISVGCAGTNISKVCRGKKKTAAGFLWQYNEIK